ncbi:MAG: hypothetical protein HC925_06120, partial [Coleofasciculaceae cyanobacterium SM2_3_26]|nr:hypothetical protein [Coleofasciculaceae cyanobacterium SM2_3_26]
MKAGIPYRPVKAPNPEAPNPEAPTTAVWEPLLQWSEHRTVSLRQLQQVLQDMLATLLSPENATQRCTALGLDEDTFATVKQTLTGIVVGCPAGYPEIYRFNLREAILAVGAVDRPDRIFFL